MVSFLNFNESGNLPFATGHGQSLKAGLHQEEISNETHITAN